MLCQADGRPGLEDPHPDDALQSNGGVGHEKQFARAWRRWSVKQAGGEDAAVHSGLPQDAVHVEADHAEPKVSRV